MDLSSEGERPEERTIPAGLPEALGPYVLKGLLGRGGMASVLRARRAGDVADVALKVMDLSRVHQDAAHLLERFSREVAILRRLTHPGIVKVLDQGEQRHAGRRLSWYAMPLITGPTLHQLLVRRGRFWISEAVRVAQDAALALAEPHAQGIVHRDIKPSNVFLEESGRVVVADFGVALLPDATTLTGQGRVWGTLAFLSPEQLIGERARPQSDVFSLGALVFTLVTGGLIRDPNAPPWSKDAPDVASRLEEIPDLPSGLGRVLRQALHNDPEARPPDGAALADALAPFTGSLPRVLPPPRRPGSDTREGTGTVVSRARVPIPYAAAALTDGHHRPPDDAPTDEQDAAPAPSPKDTFKGPCHLLQLNGAGRGRIYRIASDHVVVGRQEGCDLVLEDLSVSARHAVVVRTKGRHEVQDAESTNGIQVNGMGVPGAVLHDGDELAIGLVKLVFVGSDRDVEEVRTSLLKPAPAAPGPSTETRVEPPRQWERPPPRGYLSPSDTAVIAGVCAALGTALGWFLSGR